VALCAAQTPIGWAALSFDPTGDDLREVMTAVHTPREAALGAAWLI
jgi:hypothetical protein